MKMVESVSKRIQSSDVAMWEVRALFDALLPQFPVFPKYLGPYFESAVVKLQRGRPLGCQENAARVLKRARVSEQTDKYILVAAILPTLNIVERLFSMARTMLFLKVNISYWGVNVVHDVLETE
ncbi:hypothetical protein PC118_g21680 [Phytophthora cactorum]|nr:hypothetical protein PC115_g21646 [Phytophthora cactorum]KAG2886076.1 hypothetical protein PC117_g25432 [Phytophthora cactorum]KAG2961962.1 hypothetical protein PC118_g21680 [Phytophthora cactorum]KAG2980293.1 hypothetical protein PC120_g24992 [Phytophthora cactorum]KAG3044176.1 hypothetical protein PC121_g22072 [Phytophthora cactorum]